MNEDFTVEKLREEVNPVYSTGQSCLQLVAATGDEDAENLRKTLGLSVFGADVNERGRDVPPEILEALMKTLPVFNSVLEGRFSAFNYFIKESGARQVVDLPCGYSARGIKLAGSGVRYFGLDLPAVIDAMVPAVKEIIGENENISYDEVDATNYSSLRKALEGAEGELHITTEGLLMYFTESELETVFANIRKLLLEFGGRWVTTDNELRFAQAKLFAIITDGMPPELTAQIGNIAAGSVSKTTMGNNIFFDKDVEKVKKFISDMGFDLEFIPLSKYLPDEIVSFNKLPEDKRKQAMEALGSANIYVMTARPEAGESFSCKDEDFKADLALKGNTLDIALTGRLDTISSPGLLALYKEVEESNEISSICIDAKELEYISSAGLRVLLIMRKALGDSDWFTMVNMNDSVREIIETTGFDSIFC